MRVAGWLMGCLPVMVADWPGWGMGMQRGLFLGALQGRGHLRKGECVSTGGPGKAWGGGVQLMWSPNASVGSKQMPNVGGGDNVEL